MLLYKSKPALTYPLLIFFFAPAARDRLLSSDRVEQGRGDQDTVDIYYYVKPEHTVGVRWMILRQSSGQSKNMSRS